VKANIANFQGDPNTVMVFGESAGSGSIADHLIMPKSKGLFHRAVMESGPFVNWDAVTFDSAYNMYKQFVTNTKCSGTDSDILKCLRALTTTQVQQLVPKSCNSTCCWGPVIDGVEITEAPEILAKKGMFHKVPVMVGSNANEGTIFTKLPHSLTEEEYIKAVLQGFGQQLGQQVLLHYPATNYPSPWWASTALWGDLSFSCPARRSGRWLSTQVPVYLYFYTHVIAEINLFNKYLGSFHGAELPFVFGDPDGVYFGIPIIFTYWERILQTNMVDYWSQFAISGNPNSGATPYWPQYDSTTDSNIVLDENISVISGLKKDLCDFWDTVPY